MKKIILSFSILAATIAFSQKNERKFHSSDLITIEAKTASNSVNESNKSITTLWSDDFSNAANWVIDNSGQTGAQYGWNINNTSQGWWSANGISSTGTSGGANAELVNGNPTLSPATQALGVTYTLTTAQPIDVAALGGTNQVSIQFKQFGARFNDLQEIQISTDGTNFIAVGDNLDKEVLSAAGGSPYPNPDTKTINLSSFLSASPTQLWIRFSWTTNFPGSATNANVWIAYGWYIDDVKIISNPNYDLSITSNYWGSAGLNYYQIPTSQIAPIDFSTDVLNEGLSNLTGVTLKSEVFTGATNVYSEISPVASIPSADSATLTIANPFTPTNTPTNYTLKRKLSLGFLPNGQILSGSLSDGGNGYSTSTGLSLLGGSGSGATADITVTNGIVSDGTLQNSGSGYSTLTSVNTTQGSGTGLTLDIVANPLDHVETVQLTNGGSNYVDGPSSQTTGGTGTGLVLSISTNSGAITGAIIANSGSGYTVGDIVTVLGGDANATFEITQIQNGEIITATINNGGNGYNVGDIVDISGGTGGSFVVNSTIGGIVSSVSINNSGIGYTAGDVLTITGGSASYTVGAVTNNTEILDELPANNTIADVNFATTNYIYARDNSVFSGSTSNGTNGFEVGNLFDIWNNQTLNGLTVRLAGGTNGTAVGTEVFVKLYQINSTSGEFDFVEESAPINVATNNLNTLLTIPFYNPVDLIANTTYLAVVGSFSETLRVSNAGTTEPQTSFFLDLSDNQWYYTTSIPVVRMNFDPTVGLNDQLTNVQNISIYPNPASSSTQVDFNLTSASDVTIQVTDLSGKVVSSNLLQNVNVGNNSFEVNCSNMNNGIYYISIESNGSRITKKFVKK